MTEAELDDLLDEFDWDSWTPALRKILAPAFTQTAVEQGAREADAHDYPFSESDAFMTRHFTSYLGTRITQLDETTRALVTEELQRALADEEGETVQALATRLAAITAESAAFSPERALMIARTETAIAYNTGALAAFRQGGIEKVEVSDGDGDEECEQADGEIWTLEEALADPVAHPNCVRSFAPYLEDDDEADAA